MKLIPTKDLVRTAVALTLAAAATSAGFNAGTDSRAELSAPESSQRFTVAILADLTTGTEGGLEALGRAVAELNLLRPAFAVHIGDLVPGYIRDMDRWEQDIAAVKSVLKRLDVPLYPLPGNHDVITGTGNSDDRRGEELYKRHFGPLYYSFDYGNAHLVCLYTDEALQSRPRMSADQIDWLREDLAQSEAQHVFVFMHKPVWDYEGAGWDAVHDVLRRHPVRAVIAGHYHHYHKSLERDGIQYYVLGATGGRLFSPEVAGGVEHYCLLTVGPDDFHLALVKPGHVLPDDYVAYDDFKNMDRIRFLRPDQTGVTAAVRSPELGRVHEPVAVLVTNPLDRSLRVVVRGVSGRGKWSFQPVSKAAVVGPHGRQTVHMAIRSPQVSPREVVAPEVEVQYDYVDGRGRTAPLVLARRVPLRREVIVSLRRASISLDGRRRETEWARAPVLTTAVWRTSPYETDERGPVFRIVPTRTGLYFHAESPDGFVSAFRGERMLSDAIFVGAAADAGKVSADEMARLPVVVIFPFEPPGATQAVQAYWDPKRPTGIPAEGVHVATDRPKGRPGWQCEGFVPWHLLLAGTRPTEASVHFNIGAWDNDGDLFTQLRSWAPTDDATLWGKLVWAPRQDD